MAFRIHDVTIHLIRPDEQVAPCTMLSGDEEGGCGHQTRLPRPCKGKTDKPRPEHGPGGDKPGGGGGKSRNLAFLRARMRETLAPPPL